MCVYRIGSSALTEWSRSSSLVCGQVLPYGARRDSRSAGSIIFISIYIYIYILAWTCQLNCQFECGIVRSSGRIFYPDWYVDWIDMWARSFVLIGIGTDCQVDS